MSDNTPHSASRSDLVLRLVQAGLLTGIIDGLFSSILSVAAYGSTVARLFQGVAAVPLGPEALTRGNTTFAIGVLLHFCVAFTWSAVFIFLVMWWQWVRGLLVSWYGVLCVAALYGPFIWIVMSLIVVPIFTHRATTISIRWWIQFFGHIPFVGLPIAASARERR